MGEPGASLLTRLPSQLPRPARKSGVLDLEKRLREKRQDCLLEGDGFELPVPREKKIEKSWYPVGVQLILYASPARGTDGSLTRRWRETD